MSAPTEQPVVITGIAPGLHVRFTSPPVADWLCRCGHHERARGRAAVIELTTRVRVGHCPHAADAADAPTTEGAEVAARQGVLSALRPDPHPTTAPAADRRTAA
ncbi:hypothetical protein [Streptomyces sp. ISL-10]|uniref:hypothetical protein n=1 Tax=Streptomyces sp. ISL-10 TaxID=2819172 RepID=UPI00203632D7|nr:hypothetical protein [Streptomyces sp. ISL-10]